MLSAATAVESKESSFPVPSRARKALSYRMREVHATWHSVEIVTSCLRVSRRRRGCARCVTGGKDVVLTSDLSYKP